MDTERENMRDMRQIVEFILEIDRLKAVTRKVRPVGLDRYENSAEHSWQIAVCSIARAVRGWTTRSGPRDPYAAGA